jgi:hypothetical protein
MVNQLGEMGAVTRFDDSSAHLPAVAVKATMLASAILGDLEPKKMGDQRRLRTSWA